jgi:hypothetical protein
MSTASKYRPRNNIAPPGPMQIGYWVPLEVDTRQRRRYRLRQECAKKLIVAHRRGINTPQWPIEMPRRVRRLIVKRMAKRLTELHGLKAIT